MAQHKLPLHTHRRAAHTPRTCWRSGDSRSEHQVHTRSLSRRAASHLSCARHVPSHLQHSHSHGQSSILEGHRVLRASTQSTATSAHGSSSTSSAHSSSHDESQHRGWITHSLTHQSSHRQLRYPQCRQPTRRLSSESRSQQTRSQLATRSLRTPSLILRISSVHSTA